MAFGQLLDEKYFSLMVLFSQLPICCIISVSPHCPSTCLKLILEFHITFEAALNPLESTAPTTVFQSNSLTLFGVTTVLELLFLCPQRGNFLTRMPAFYLNRTISFFIYDRLHVCATILYAQFNQVSLIVGLSWVFIMLSDSRGVYVLVCAA